MDYLWQTRMGQDCGGQRIRNEENDARKWKREIAKTRIIILVVHIAR